MFERFDELLSDHERRLRTTMVTGIVSAIEAAPYRARVKIDGLATAETSFLPIAVASSDGWHPLKIGDQVVVGCRDGEVPHGIILGVLYYEGQQAPSRDLGAQGVKKEGFALHHTKGSLELRLKKLAVHRGSDELLSLLIEVLDLVCTSTTATLTGPQPLLPAQQKWLLLKEKLKGFC